MTKPCPRDTNGDGDCAFPLCPVCHPENRPKRRKRKKPKRRYLAVHRRVRVNMGEGNVDAWVYIGKDGITVRRLYSRSSWFLPWPEAAGAVARAAQVRAASNMALGVIRG